MGEKNIDFIVKKDGGKNREREEEKGKEELKWSNPAPLSKEENKEKKWGAKRLPRLFSFWIKDKKDNKDINKENIKNLREEVLKTIKEKEEKNTPIFTREKIKENEKKELADGIDLLPKADTRLDAHLVKGAEKNYKEKKVVEEKKAEWERTDVLETNLIEGEMVSFFNVKKNISFLIIVFSLVILILGGSYLGMYFWTKEINKTTEDSTRVSGAQNQQITVLEKEKKEIYTFGRKLELVEYLLNNHVYWTNFLRFLEENTLNEVYYISFSGDLGGSYGLPAVTQNYSLIDKQIETFLKNKEVNEVSVKSGQFGAGSTDKASVIFNLDLKINPNIFFKNGDKK